MWNSDAIAFLASPIISHYHSAYSIINVLNGFVQALLKLYNDNTAYWQIYPHYLTSLIWYHLKRKAALIKKLKLMALSAPLSWTLTCALNEKSWCLAAKCSSVLSSSLSENNIDESSKTEPTTTVRVLDQNSTNRELCGAEGRETYSLWLSKL